MQEGRVAAQKSDFKSALEKFNSARRCDATKSDSVDIETNLLFNKILALKNRADANEKKAVEVTKKLTKTLDEVEEEQAKNRRIIDAFDFYDGRFGLVIKKSGGAFNSGFSTEFDISDNRYGFINKNGEIVIDYIYKEATPFDDYDGYARVMREEKTYLLDTLGKEYLLAQSIEEINKTVRALDLHEKKFETLPALAFQVPELRILLLYRTQLQELPFHIKNLQKLTRLNLGLNENFKTLPKEIGELTELEDLNLEGTIIRTLPEEIKNLKNLRKLSLGYNAHLQELPKEIGQLKKLQYLSLMGSGILNLPNEIEKLENLQILNLHYCRDLKSLRKEIGNLKQLQLLDLGNNYNLREIPKEIGQLKKLQNLSLGGERLNVIPDEISKLVNLKFLSLTNSSIVAIPDGIGKLINLTNLDLSGNKNIETIPQ